ncbi:MAG TPA: SDR family NAD(P)-dependent oxidoreductase, partial [Sphingobium sp.]
MGKLEGRHILVTGAASGMGRAIAQQFAAEGAALALLDRNEAGAAEVAGALGAVSFGCDVSDRAMVDDVVARAGEALDAIDGVINAAGILDIMPIDTLSPESWDRMIAVNLTGTFN